jgi:glutaminyl-peptide cyclotransferase
MNKSALRSTAPPPKKLSGQNMFLGGAILAFFAAVVMWLMLFHDGDNNHAEAAVSRFKLEDIPFNGKQAYEYLKQLCAIGPRPSGSKGMEAQQELLETHFKKLGGKVEYQKFQAVHPGTGAAVQMANMIVQWHPEAKNRILLCAHYDTLPLPMMDPENPRGTFVGANDNAGGVAILMQLAGEIAKNEYHFGIDFALFDGEEFVFSRQDEFFLGAKHFAKQYRDQPPAYRYRWGVLLDMVSGKNLQLYQERGSMGWKDTQPLVKEIWSVADRLKVKEFIPRRKHRVDDDHIPLHDIGKISCIDVIDFDYEPWHTEGDTPDECSPLSMAKVGWVVGEWLKGAK